MSKHQARCLCGWKGGWTVDARYAKAEGAVHSRYHAGAEAFDHEILVVPGNGVDYVERP